MGGWAERAESRSGAAVSKEGPGTPGEGLRETLPWGLQAAHSRGHRGWAGTANNELAWQAAATGTVVPELAPATRGSSSVALLPPGNGPWGHSLLIFQGELELPMFT